MTANTIDGSRTAARKAPAGRATSAIALPIALGALAVLLGSRILWQTLASPLPDEAYYWLWGQRLDWSYYDHPPLQAWLQRAFHALGAEGLAGLRATTWLTSALLALALGLLLRPYLGTRDRAVVLVSVFASPVIFVFTTITFPDHLMLALLALAALGFVHVARRLEAGAALPLPALYAAALCMGLAMLTKVNAVLFVLGAFAAILAAPSLRQLLRNVHFHLAAALVVVCQVPVLWWNLTHAGESYRYNLAGRLAFDPARMAVNLAEFLPLALVALSPFLLPALVRFSLGPAVNPWQRLAWWVLAVSAVFWVAMSALTPVFYYWILPAWVALLPLLLSDMRRGAALVAHLATGCVVAVGFTLNALLLPLAALFGAADDETSLLYGWAEVAPAVQQARLEADAGFLLATDYRHGAILAFHTGDRAVEVISPRRSQFDLWFDETARGGQSAVILTTRWHPMRPDIEARFATVTPVSEHRITRLGRPVASYGIWLGAGYIPRTSDP